MNSCLVSSGTCLNTKEKNLERIYQVCDMFGCSVKTMKE